MKESVMSDVLSVALSGLVAQSQRLDVAANNIANATTSGRVPTAADPATTVYKPLDVSFTALMTGGVQGQVTENPNGTSLSYDPSNIYANDQGYIAVPNVDIARELVNILETKTLFRANVSVIRTQEQMQKDLLDTIA
jgi:flagellar basal-body rod protein FlgC